MLRTIKLKLYKNNHLELEEKNIKCIEQRGNYSFKLKDSKMIINDRMFIRENDEFKFSLSFKEKTCTYLFKERNITYDIKVEKLEFHKNSTNIEIIYKIETDESETRILLEKDGE